MSLFQKLIASFDNTTEGFAARKLSAFAAVVAAIYFSYQNCTPENVVELVVTWLVFALLCLGLVTVQNIIDFKNGKSVETPKP